jgi:hypothetical protein
MDSDHRRFERYDEFAAIQRSFLAIDLESEPTAFQNKQESGLIAKLSEIVRVFNDGGEMRNTTDLPLSSMTTKNNHIFWTLS